MCCACLSSYAARLKPNLSLFVGVNVGWALCGHDMPQPSSSAPNHGEVTEETSRRYHDGWHPADMFTLSERMALGMACKQLIDAGRCAWLCGQVAAIPTPSHGGVWCVRQASYVPTTLSGENNLILVHTAQTDTMAKS
jgi:hypothetical protein